MPRLQALSASIQQPYNWEIIARVLKYQPPLGCKRLPMFILVAWRVPNMVFVGRSLDLKGERLGYDLENVLTRTRE